MKMSTSHTILAVLIVGFLSYSDSAFLPKFHSGASIQQVSRDPVKLPGEGGTGGDPFDDVALTNESESSQIVGIRSLNISYSIYNIESIQVTYIVANGSDYRAPVRGRPTSQSVVINFEPIEHVTSIEGSTNGTVINQLAVTTLGPDYEQKVYGPFGSSGPMTFKTNGYTIGFHGRSSNNLTNIGVYVLEELTKSELFGPGTGGSPFDDEADLLVPPAIQISTLTIWHGDVINGIQVEYLLFGGGKHSGLVHGGTNTTFSTTIRLEEGEVFELVELKSFGEEPNSYISMLTFYIKNKDGNIEVLGPFGRKGDDTSHSLSANLLGVYGYGGDYIDKLGFYYL